MGRVYNALVKADQLTDRQRPIGRPVSQDRYPNAATESAREAVSSNAPEHDFENDNQTAPVDFDNGFSLSDAFINERIAEPFTTPPTVEQFASSPRVTRGGTSRDSASSVSLPIKPIFAEPREVINIESLRLDPHCAALTGSDGLALERYRTLAVRIAARRKLKTILITSAQDGEGKSTVALNLAWVMARRDNRRVLLIDASQRGTALKMASGRGWLEMNNVSSELTDSIVRLDPNGLYLLRASAGHKQADDKQSDLNGSEMDDALASLKFEKMVAELGGYFDFIVIDGPTICGSVGTQQLASIADGTIVVARAGHTHHGHITRAVELVPQERRLGIVLNESEVAPRNSGNASFIKRLFGRRS
ncbi:MAG: CpsD/CapB family tyrosine-protein kinase [Blastocatellia bacterium]